jgi:Mycothiol maleylpyruvate isomerase N-terminal domain
MNAADILKYGHLTVCRAIEALPESDWETSGVCGYWSTKDIIGHLAAYEHALEDVLSSFLGSGETPYLEQFKKGPDFNDQQAALRKPHSVQQVLGEYNDTHARVVLLVPKIAPEVWRKAGSLPWYGMEYALDDFIVYAFYGHKREHSAQIAVFRDTLKQR